MKNFVTNLFLSLLFSPSLYAVAGFGDGGGEADVAFAISLWAIPLQVILVEIFYDVNVISKTGFIRRSNCYTLIAIQIFIIGIVTASFFSLLAYPIFFLLLLNLCRLIIKITSKWPLVRIKGLVAFILFFFLTATSLTQLTKGYNAVYCTSKQKEVETFFQIFQGQCDSILHFNIQYDWGYHRKKFVSFFVYYFL